MKTVSTTVVLFFILSIPCFAAKPNQVAIETELGTIVLELLVDTAPISSKDFLTYVNKSLYTDQGFYRVVRDDNDQGTPKIDVIQGGLLDEDSGLAQVAHETTTTTGLKHIRGSVSLARGDVGSGSAAYFFIVVKDSPSLDFGGKRNPDGQGFATFATVVKGMELVDRIHQTAADKLTGKDHMKGQTLKKPIKILRARALSAQHALSKGR